MNANLLLDRLDEVSDWMFYEGTKRWGSCAFPERAEFTVTRIAHGSEHGSTYFCASLFETNSGLKVPLVHRLQENDVVSLDAGDLAGAAMATIGLLNDAGGGDVHNALLDAIADLLGSIGSDNCPMRLISLNARPVVIDRDHATLGFEAQLRMLGDDLKSTVYFMRIKDADDFRQCFFSEILPEQRARAAGAAGFDVPEAIND